MNKLGLLAATLGLTLGVVRAAAALNADDYRGGWEMDATDPHTYEFSIRGDQVRGIYCTHCSDATTLAFIDGKLGPDGIVFVVTHVRDDGSTAYLDHAIARFDHGRMVVTGTSGAVGGGGFHWTLHKDPRGPDPLPIPVSRLPPAPPVPAVPFPPGLLRGRPYVQPGPLRQLSAAQVIGVWIAGTGINKQFFIIRRVGDKLRGMVCGRCDNPYTMAALDDFQIRGETMTFNILHEDWGPGSLPFHNQATVRVTENEMLLSTHQDNNADVPRTARPAGRSFVFSMSGPIPVEATAGN